MMIVEQMLKNAPKPLLHIADVSGSALFQGDCLDIMPLIPDNSIDLILCDIPYGTTACKWDSVIPFDKMWEQLKRIRKDNTAILLFGSEPFSSNLRMSNMKEYKYDWIWDKKKPSTGLHANIMPLKKHEIISVFYQKSGKYHPIMEDSENRIDKPRMANNGEAFGGKEILRQHTNNGKKYPKSIIEISNANQNNRYHGTQKPLELMEYLINTYTNENDLILDFTCGSGTTLVAAKNLNRKFIGIEKEPKYYEIACRRCGF